MSATSHTFQTEVQQLLHLMIHSLYSEREIFLRELVSNASDACDKLRFQALTDSSLMTGDDELKVQVTFDKEAKTITIADNGIGLTEAEAGDHLGTIAKSGTKEFMSKLADADKSEAQSLIGQFGVGFYSSFMVADKVVVESRSATVGSDAGVRWESEGDGSYSTETIVRPQRGTTITLHLKDDADEFADGYRVRSLIKKYSDFVSYPIMMPKTPTDEEKEKDEDPGFEQVNESTALWTKSKDDITDEQYNEFYKTACKQWDEPATRLHFNVEGQLEFTALLFIPGQKPFDFMDRSKRGLSLYVRKVFILDDAEELLPDYLRFVKGVVDSSDLPLNVSREMLQQQAIVGKLRKIIVKRVLDHLTKLSKSEDEQDQQTWATIEREFGPVLREGIANDYENKDKLAKLARYRSTWTDSEDLAADEKPAEPSKTGYEAYVERMKEGQDAIYYVTAPSFEAAKASPHLEGYVTKGFEVIYLVEPVDDWLMSMGGFADFDGKKLVHIAKGGDDLSSDEEKAELEEAKKTYGDLLTFASGKVDGVKEVRLSARLTDSPACLVGDEGSMSQGMEELMRSMGREMPTQERILELNPKHTLVQAIDRVHKDEPDDAASYLGLLRDQAILAEGGRLDDGADFARRLQDLMGKAIG